MTVTAGSICLPRTTSISTSPPRPFRNRSLPLQRASGRVWPPGSPAARTSSTKRRRWKVRGRLRAIGHHAPSGARPRRQYARLQRRRVVDLAVANDSNPSALCVNNKDGTFKTSASKPAAPTARTASRRRAWASPSATTTATGQLTSSRPTSRRYLDAVPERRQGLLRGSHLLGWNRIIAAGWTGVAFVDLDNDGWRTSSS